MLDTVVQQEPIDTSSTAPDVIEPPILAMGVGTEDQINKRQLPPYGEFCDTTVTSEKQTGNIYKKVISFALFPAESGGGLSDWLVKGVSINIQSAKLYYPDWVVRIYCTDCSANDAAAILAFDNTEIVHCRNDTILDTSNARKMIKRFLAVDDPSVWYTNVRDVDSRFSPRELMAVNEWIGSGLGFHSMRDHPAHVVPIMGCSFGMKRGVLDKTTMTALAKEAASSPHISGCCGEDQSFLQSFVWPRVKGLSMSHDMDQGRCRSHGAVSCRDFPLGPRIQENNFFVGAPFKPGSGDMAVTETGYSCSLECKPTQLVLNSTI
jgi:hypothetical protein